MKPRCDNLVDDSFLIPLHYTDPFIRLATDTSDTDIWHGLSFRMNDDMHDYMAKEPKTRRVTANLPADLLEEACEVSGVGITETLIEGLTLVMRRRAAAKAAKLRGRLILDIDLDESRERHRR